MLKLVAFINCIALVFYLSACKSKCHDATNPECENYNPCIGKNPAKADFKIEEEIGPALVETDTTYAPNMVRCTPLVEFDSCKWLIGTEVVTDKVLRRKNFPEQTWINVTLIVYKKPDSHCHPTDDGVDTLTKKFFSAAKESLLVFGYFNGYNTQQPADTFTVQTVTYDSVWGSIFDLRNLPKSTTDKFFADNIELGGRGAYTRSSNNGMQSRFALESVLVVRNGKINIEYSYNDEAYKAWLEGRTPQAPVRVSKTFTGKKL